MAASGRGGRPRPVNVTQPFPGLHQVPSWPKLVATVRDDGTGTLMVNGTSRPCSAESVTALRTGMVARCVAIATSLHRPVRLDVTEGGETYGLAVRPEGFVQLVEPDGTIPAPDGLTVDEGRCRHCRRLQPVTSTTCGQCGVDEPLRVEVAPPSKPNDLAPAPLAPVLVTDVPVAAPPAPPDAGATAVGMALPPQPAVELHDVELTRMRTPAVPDQPARPRLHLVFTSREPVTVEDGATIGRQPTAEGGRRPIPVPSPGRMLSRTHAAIDLDEDGQIIVTDLHAGNGVSLQTEPPVDLIPGEPTVVPEGATILLGDVYCTVATM